MPLHHRAEVEVICDNWPDRQGPCGMREVVPVEIQMDGPAWYKAQDQLRKQGWFIKDDKVVCPNCVQMSK